MAGASQAVVDALAQTAAEPGPSSVVEARHLPKPPTPPPSPPLAPTEPSKAKPGKREGGKKDKTKAVDGPKPRGAEFDQMEEYAKPIPALLLTQKASFSCLAQLHPAL
jgi:hypothetical protein